MIKSCRVRTLFDTHFMNFIVYKLNFVLCIWWYFFINFALAFITNLLLNPLTACVEYTLHVRLKYIVSIL